VVFVVLSEHTRQEVAKNARSQLESVGANILGVVINKKKYYIPNFIYRRL
jgi:Mrp family chromosome partitioning ATPase